MTANDKSYIADFVLAIFLVGVSILIFLESLNLRPSVYEPLGPAAVPRALAISLVILSIPVIIQGGKKLRKARSAPEEEAVESEPSGQIKGPQRPLLSLLTGVATIVYIFAVQLIGFRISSIVLLIFLGAMVHRRERKMRPVVFFPTLFVLAVGMSQLLYFVFTRVLVVNLR